MDTGHIAHEASSSILSDAPLSHFFLQSRVSCRRYFSLNCVPLHSPCRRTRKTTLVPNHSHHTKGFSILQLVSLHVPAGILLESLTNSCEILLSFRSRTWLRWGGGIRGQSGIKHNVSVDNKHSTSLQSHHFNFKAHHALPIHRCLFAPRSWIGSKTSRCKVQSSSGCAQSVHY